MLLFLNYTIMITEKHLIPSDASIKYISNRIKIFGSISSVTKYLILSFLPIIILIYKKITVMEFLILMLVLLGICTIWFIFTRKRNILIRHYNLHVWLADLAKYPDKIHHDKYFSPKE